LFKLLYYKIVISMARWFPSGLSALSGQISNFTKEVLAEGIEEIDGTFVNHAHFDTIHLVAVTGQLTGDYKGRLTVVKKR